MSFKTQMYMSNMKNLDLYHLCMICKLYDKAYKQYSGIYQHQRLIACSFFRTDSWVCKCCSLHVYPIAQPPCNCLNFGPKIFISFRPDIVNEIRAVQNELCKVHISSDICFPEFFS